MKHFMLMLSRATSSEQYLNGTMGTIISYLIPMPKSSTSTLEHGVLLAIRLSASSTVHEFVPSLALRDK